MASGVCDAYCLFGRVWSERAIWEYFSSHCYFLSGTLVSPKCFCLAGGTVAVCNLIFMLE